MKKILILGGANVHCKLVQAAKELGLYTIVTDYLEDSPAKKMADESWMFSITDVDGIVEACRTARVDAVLSTHLDPCQRPYYEICHRLDLPCYIETREQVFSLTDKDAFKALCVRSGMDVIPTYDSVDSPAIEFPVFVKPSNSRGSRGQKICGSREELLEAVTTAKAVSDNGRVIIEKYMGNKHDFTVTYLIVEGQPHLIKIADRYLGSVESGFDRLAIASCSPSCHTNMYREKVEPQVFRMFQELDIRNGPVFMQGFVDGDTVRFYDPGFRFPGAEYELMIRKVWGIDIMKMMVEFALTGKFSKANGVLRPDMAEMNGKLAGMLLPTVRPGKVGQIRGLQELAACGPMVCYTIRNGPGEVVPETRDVNQLFGEFNVVCDSLDEYKAFFRKIQETLQVLDDHGEEMLVDAFCVDELDERMENVVR